MCAPANALPNIRPTSNPDLNEKKSWVGRDNAMMALVYYATALYSSDGHAGQSIKSSPQALTPYLLPAKRFSPPCLLIVCIHSRQFRLCKRLTMTQSLQLSLRWRATCSPMMHLCPWPGSEVLCFLSPHYSTFFNTSKTARSTCICS